MIRWSPVGELTQLTVANQRDLIIIHNPWDYTISNTNCIMLIPIIVYMLVTIKYPKGLCIIINPKGINCSCVTYLSFMGRLKTTKRGFIFKESSMPSHKQRFSFDAV